MKPRTKEQAATWQWLQKATDDPVYPGRAVLIGVNFTKEEQQATDGKRLHIAKDQWYGNEGIFFINDGKKLNKTPKDYKAVKVDGQYPRVSFVLPKDDPIQTVILNRDYLLDAVSMPSEYVKLEFRGDTKPLVIRDYDLETKKIGEKYIAVVMPMHLGRR